MVNISFEQRIFWIEEMSNFLDDRSRNELLTKADRKSKLFEDYLSKVEVLSDKEGDMRGKLTQFYNLTNAYRNACNRELNPLESEIQENIRRGPLANNRDLKKSVNIDYVQAKKAFSDQDQNLRKRMSEILNAPKK